MAKPMKQMTNQSLKDLLAHLGFEKSEGMVKYHRAWRHPETGTLLLLPANKINEPPLSAVLLSVRTHLDANGHLEGAAFDEFVRTGHLPVAS